MRPIPPLALLLTVLMATPAFGSWAGTRDWTFGDDGIARLDVAPGQAVHGTDIAIQTGGRILAAGYADAGSGTTALVTALTSDGRSDATWGNGGTVVLDGVAAMAGGWSRVQLLPLDSGQALVLGGALVRVSANGVLDASFGGGTGRAALPAAFVPGGGRVAADGRIVLVGGYPDGGETAGAVVRLTPDGLADPTFDGDGLALLPADGTAGGKPASTSGLTGAAVRSDNSVYVAGPATSTAFSGPDPFVVARLTATGALDPAFGDGGRVVQHGESGYEPSSVQVAATGGPLFGGVPCFKYVCVPGSLTLAADGAGPTPGSFTYSNGTGVVLLPVASDAWLWTRTTGSALQLAVTGLALGKDEQGADSYYTDDEVDARLPPSVESAGRVVLQPDGKALATGTATEASGARRLAVVRVFGLSPRTVRSLVFPTTTATATRLAAALPVICPLRRCRAVAELRAGPEVLARGALDTLTNGPLPLVLQWTPKGRRSRPARARLTVTLRGGQPTTTDVTLRWVGTAPKAGDAFGPMRYLAGAVKAFATDGRRSLAFTQTGSVQLLDLHTRRRYAVPSPARCGAPAVDVSFPMVLLTCPSNAVLVDLRTGGVRRFGKSTPQLGRVWVGPVTVPCRTVVAGTRCDRYVAWGTGRSRTLREDDVISHALPRDLDSRDLAQVRGCPPVESPSWPSGVLTDPDLYDWPYVLLLRTADPGQNPQPGLFVARCSGIGNDAERRRLADEPVSPQLGGGLATWATKGTAEVFAYAVATGEQTRWAAPGGDESLREPARIAPARDAVVVGAATHQDCTNAVDCVSDAWTLSLAERRR